MLLQSHNGEVHCCPHCPMSGPKAASAGSVTRFHDHEQLFHAGVRHNIAITQREERGSAEVEFIRPGKVQRVARFERPVKRSKARNQTASPNH